MTYPNDQTTTYSYFWTTSTISGCRRFITRIRVRRRCQKFDYTYDTVGNILTWRQERAGSAAQASTPSRTTSSIN